MKTPIAITRLPDSRLMFIAPWRTPMSATSARRMCAPSAVSTRIWRTVSASAPRLGRQPHDDAEPLLAFPDLGGLLAAERGLDRVLDVGDVQAIAGGALPIDRDLQLRHLSGAIDEGARDAAAFPTPRRRTAVASFRSAAPSAPNTLITTWPSICEMLSRMLSRIGCEKLASMPGNRVERAIHLGDELLLGDVPRPLGRRLHVHEELRHVDQLGVGAVFRPARFRDHRADFRKLAEQRADAASTRARPR